MKFDHYYIILTPNKTVILITFQTYISRLSRLLLLVNIFNVHIFKTNHIFDANNLTHNCTSKLEINPIHILTIN